nr:stress response protein nst1-like isoform X2 [Setaria viridis]
MASSKRSESRTPIHDPFNTTSQSDNGGIHVGGSVASNDIPPPLEPREWRRQRDRNRYKLMSIQKKEELLKKRRENYQRSKSAPANVEVGRNQLLGENIASDENRVEQRPELTGEQTESRRAKDRARYANVTPKQRQAMRDRQNARNMKPEQKEAKRDQYKARRELRRNTLHKDSIAMVNPRYNPM